MHIKLFGLYDAKAIFVKNNNNTAQRIAGGGDRGGHTFPKCISSNMNIIAWLEFKFASVH